VRIFETIQAQPGITKRALSEHLEISYGSIESRLAALESHGMLISEDNYGHLYPMEAI
jgi:predicted transcriptional regulator